VEAVPSAFRGELKKAARQICADIYELDQKYFSHDPTIMPLDGGGDPRVAELAEALLGWGSPFLSGDPDHNVSL
jgi:hypothetical protein